MLDTSNEMLDRSNEMLERSNEMVVKPPHSNLGDNSLQSWGRFTVMHLGEKASNLGDDSQVIYDASW
ncbi:hypothetical protein TNCV_3969721 [Trichonephila clavipes]|nr:hypothetical protein TNCV_3969721 [Trichonephila clavipes]